MYEQIEQQLKEQELAKTNATGTTEQKPVETPVENKPVEEVKPAEQTPQNVETAPQKTEVPAEEQKGSILQHNLFAPYLYGRYTYE